MKLARMSKLLILLLLTSILLAGCTNLEKETAQWTIGISQLADHPALDDARLGFEEGLKELGLEAKIIIQNAQGEPANAMTIAEKFVKDKVDLIYAIATPAAQTAKQASSEIPILFSAVTDPIDAELVDSQDSPGGNISGTSDAAPMEEQLPLFKDLDPDIKKIGILFNTSEPNSQVQIDMAEEIAKDLDLEIVTSGISNINDIPQAMDSLIKKVDAIYTITDNMVASAISVVAEKANAKQMVTIAAESSHVDGGILMTKGISYYEIGKQTARMAKEILEDGKSASDIPFEFAENISKVVNEKTMETLGFDENKEIFKDAEKITD